MVMRALVFLAIVGVAFGYYSLCKGIKRSDIKAVYNQVQVPALFFLGASCPSFDIDTVAIDGECQSLVRQATCYGIKATKHYDVEVVNYELLAEDVRNIEKLGTIACDRSRACFRQVIDALQTCLDENENFLNETIDAFEQVYNDIYVDALTAFAAGNKGSLLGDIALRALDLFDSVHDILTFIGRLVTEVVRRDARVAAEETERLAQDFCDSGCIRQTAQFLKSIFSYLHGGQCLDASKFCGDCEDRAETWFSRPKNKLPCCIVEFVLKGIEASYYVVKNYDDVFNQIIGKHPSDTAVEEAIAVREKLAAEVGCVSNVYATNIPEYCQYSSGSSEGGLISPTCILNCGGKLFECALPCCFGICVWSSSCRSCLGHLWSTCKDCFKENKLQEQTFFYEYFQFYNFYPIILAPF